MNPTQYTDYLIRNKNAKEFFARQLGLTKKQIQECIYELIDLAKEKNGTITPADLIAKATVGTTASYAIFNWNGTEEERLAIAKSILDQLTFLIDKDGKIYQINPPA